MKQRSKNLIRQHDDIALGCYFEYISLFRGREDGAGRIVGVVQDDEFGFRGEEGLQVAEVGFPGVFGVEVPVGDCGSEGRGEREQCAVGGVERDYVVIGGDEGLEGEEVGAGCTGRYYLCWDGSAGSR